MDYRPNRVFARLFNRGGRFGVVAISEGVAVRSRPQASIASASSDS